VLGLVAVVVLPPVTALGVILPTTWRANEPLRASQSQIAGLTGISTVAGAAGSLAASFGLPVVGLWGSFALLIVGYLLIAAGVFWRQRTAGPLMLLALYGAGGCLLCVHTLQSASTGSRGEKLLQRWESAYGWIDAVELADGSRTVRQNLHYGFGSSRNSVVRDYRSGHLPLLLHSNPKDVVFLGMGTGQTAAAALSHNELLSITVVELIPEAVAAARYLEQTNRGLVDHPRVEFHVNDARRFLSSSGRKFDVIVSDLFVPWESHTGYLYTVEHYRAGRASLRPGGLFCQWLPVYQLGPAEFELIANSFAEVFPHTRLWWVRAYANYPVLGLIGSEEPIDFAATPAAAGFHETHPHAGTRDEWLADGNALLSYYIGDWQRTPGAALNTDEHPRVEFSAPIAHVEDAKLRRKRLREWHEQVLAKLPQDSILTHNFAGPAKDHTWRLREQRRLLGIE
jgi:spermidine synthase